MVGAALSYFSPVLSGSLAPPGLGAGPAVGVSAGYRWTFLYFGAAYQHAFLAGATYQQDVETGRTLSASSDYLGFDLAAITSPDAVTAAFFRIGAGGRFIRATRTLDGVQDPPTSTTNIDLLVGIGVQIKASDWLRIVPQATFEVGPLNAYTSLGVTTYFDFAKPVR
jgi:hypothetical protein